MQPHGRAWGSFRHLHETVSDRGNSQEVFRRDGKEMSRSWERERETQDQGGCVRFGGEASGLCMGDDQYIRKSWGSGGREEVLNRAEVLRSLSKWLDSYRQCVGMYWWGQIIVRRNASMQA